MTEGTVFTGVCHSFCPQGGVGAWSGGLWSSRGRCLAGGNGLVGGVGTWPGGKTSEADTPPIYARIRSFGGRYASYWNALLLYVHVYHD